MPRNGSGSYDLPITFVAGTPATAADQNTQDGDIATALTQSLCTDGQSTMTGQMKGYSGTVLAPGYTFASGTGNGFYLAGAGQIGIATLSTVVGTFNNDQSVTWYGAVTTAGAAVFSSTVSVAGVLSLTATSNMLLPVGTTAQRPVAATAGFFRYNSTLSTPEFADGANWNGLVPFGIQGTFKNLAIKVASNTTVTVTADAVMLYNGTASYYPALSVSATCNLGTAGAVNALDAGTIAIDSWYYIYVIYNGTTIGTLASLSATAPTMPSGYTFKARIGAVQTIHGSATLYGTWQLGRTAQYVVGLAQTATAVQMATGSAGNITTGPRDALALARYVPTTAASIKVFANTNNSASSVTEVAPNASSGGNASTTNPPPLITTSSSAQQSANAQFILESTNIYWASNGGAVYCLGWEDNI